MVLKAIIVGMTTLWLLWAGAGCSAPVQVFSKVITASSLIERRLSIEEVTCEDRHCRLVRVRLAEPPGLLDRSFLEHKVRLELEEPSYLHIMRGFIRDVADPRGILIVEYNEGDRQPDARGRLSFDGLYILQEKAVHITDPGS